MSHINLMPWREGLRQQQKQRYLGVLAFVALLALGAVLAAGAFIDGLIENQNQRNQFMQVQIAVLDIKIERIKNIRQSKQAIEQRMALIEQLQASRNIAPHVVDELAKLVPPGISFRGLTRRDNQIEVVGVSESNNRLADFMRRLDDSDVFINGELSSIVAGASATDAVSEFKLKVTINPTIAPDFSKLITPQTEEEAQ